jgi:hypothetical protein
MNSELYGKLNKQQLAKLPAKYKQNFEVLKLLVLFPIGLAKAI